MTKRRQHSSQEGGYCYKVMPFGLKNASVTYQRLVNAMFTDHLGRTMEVYIDDMLVKSLKAKDHVGHLADISQFLDSITCVLILINVLLASRPGSSWAILSHNEESKPT